MEAAWLAAVILVPVFFDVYSSRIFEPDKISILRSLALLTLAAWVIKLAEGGGFRWKERPRDVSLVKYLLSYPLISPVLGLVLIYVISTIFSVTPSISFFGSYQRLQGTYTTLSYLVIFASIISNLRSRNQINRLVTTIILASLPVSFYGLLQHYQIDPIPWGGNTSTRIASNMGNSIFVAAYLIMVFPLTIARLVASFKEILNENGQVSGTGIRTIKQIIKATIYVVIAALELIAIYMSGSRGPLLGLMAALYFMVFLLSLFWRKRWLTFIIIGLALLGGVFLIVFNIKNGPLEALKSSPAIGRFGILLDPESNSALVRQYIWEGTVDLVGVHDPLKFPDGSSDPYNLIRPIIGYGPEAMYVAYNQFYVPELGQVEKRNASPDRAHNETWDSVVITGFAGLLVYLSVFSSVFYYGLKWQGLIPSKRNKLFFFICLIGGGVIGSVSLIMLKGIEFLGVGLPFGMIIGVIGYLTIYGLFSLYRKNEQMPKNPNTYLLIFLLAAIVGHFVEINFGIAIVATRTLFWTYSGMLLVIGFVLPKVSLPESQPQDAGETDPEIVSPMNRKKDRRGASIHRRKTARNKRTIIGDQPLWMRNTLIGAVIVGVIISTLGYDYITNSDHSRSVLVILVNSLTRLGNKDNAFSPGILALVLVTFIIGIFLLASENDDHQDHSSWLQSVGIMTLAGFAIGLFFWFLQAISLALLASFTPTSQNDVIAQVNNIGSLLTKYYLYIFLIILLISFILMEEWQQRGRSTTTVGIVLAPVILIVLLVFTNVSNLKVIHADITFKMAEPFSKGNQLQVATFLYKYALEKAPREDHYYLFLGRNYLEQAKITEKTEDQDALVLQAENDLKVAQSINPLNTDHTANLARLYSWWAGKTTDPTVSSDRAQKASDYYATAVTLSPNNSTLWDEWAVLLMQVIHQPQQALQRLQHALSLDARFSLTQGLMGDYYLRVANSAADMTAKLQAYESAAAYYRTAADVAKKTDTTSKASYLVSLGNVYILMANSDPQNLNREQIQQAIDVLLESLNAGIGKTDAWKIQEAIAKLYFQLGDNSSAQYYAAQALATAPSSATSRIQDLITQTLSIP